jgi:hypothetical protein
MLKRAKKKNVSGERLCGPHHTHTRSTHQPPHTTVNRVEQDCCRGECLPVALRSIVGVRLATGGGAVLRDAEPVADPGFAFEGRGGLLADLGAGGDGLGRFGATGGVRFGCC